jgi:sensor histidine kinase regulating citrate/malate metabolism|tara:strand:+ start:541 stop:813 length:273 start_codon:yes stop_codon:yes gene_type:complete
MTLIVNAVDAIEDTGRIVISSLIAGDEIRVRITDAGKGLQPERLSRIFEVGFVERGATMRMNVGLDVPKRGSSARREYRGPERGRGGNNV